jgi:hypothetical protein
LAQDSARGAVAVHTRAGAAPDILTIYVAGSCANCRYAYELAQLIRTRYPHVRVRMVDLENAAEAIPEQVFATPTYLLNGQVWSLGNPSPEKLDSTFARW